MNIDAFWGITLSLLVLRHWWKNRPYTPKPPKQNLPTTNVAGAQATQSALKAAEIARQQRQRDIADLKKQGYTDELIATMLPIVENDN